MLGQLDRLLRAARKPIGCGTGNVQQLVILHRQGKEADTLRLLGLPQNWGQAAIAIGGDGSLAGWNFCPKPEPSVPL